MVRAARSYSLPRFLFTLSASGGLQKNTAVLVVITGLDSTVFIGGIKVETRPLIFSVFLPIFLATPATSLPEGLDLTLFTDEDSGWISVTIGVDSAEHYLESASVEVGEVAADQPRRFELVVTITGQLNDGASYEGDSWWREEPVRGRMAELSAGGGVSCYEVGGVDRNLAWVVASIGPASLDEEISSTFETTTEAGRENFIATWRFTGWLGVEPEYE